MADERDHFALTATPLSLVPVSTTTLAQQSSPTLFTMRASRIAQYTFDIRIPCYRHAPTVSSLATRRISLLTDLRNSTRVSRRSITWTSTPRQFPTSGFHLTNPSETLKEKLYQQKNIIPFSKGRCLAIGIKPLPSWATG